MTYELELVGFTNLSCDHLLRYEIAQTNWLCMCKNAVVSCQNFPLTIAKSFKNELEIFNHFVTLSLLKYRLHLPKSPLAY